MNWLTKKARSDGSRIERNIRRLENLRSRVHDLSYFVVASNSGGYQYLTDLLKENIVKGRPRVQAKLEEALLGENNQKVALDAPMRFQRLMREAEELIQLEIVKEKRQLKELK